MLKIKCTQTTKIDQVKHDIFVPIVLRKAFGQKMFLVGDKNKHFFKNKYKNNEPKNWKTLITFGPQAFYYLFLIAVPPTAIGLKPCVCKSFKKT